LTSLTDIVETLLAYHIFPAIIRSCFEELFYMIDAASFNRFDYKDINIAGETTHHTYTIRLLQQRSLCTTKNGLNIKMKLSQVCLLL